MRPKAGMQFPSPMPSELSFKSIQIERGIMRRGYTCLWRKIWANTDLVVPGRQFTKFEAWLFITNMLAAGVDNPAAGRKRGEFVASIRFLARTFNWSHAMAQRFINQLLENSMIERVITESIDPAMQGASRFTVCNYETYNTPRNTERYAEQYADRYKYKKGIKEGKNKEKDIHTPASQEARVSPMTLLEIYQQHNQSLPEVKTLTSERLKKCQSRIDQGVRDGCLEQYLADFTAAVKKAQQTPFLRGEGSSGWRANFDWFVANHVNAYAVLEGKYDGSGTGSNHGNGGGYDHASFNRSGFRLPGRTSSGDPMYIPRQ
jgi:hypothetical protein